MKYAIVYSSRTGNTKLLAERMKEVLTKENCIYFGEPNEEALKAPMLYIGFWTNKGSTDENTIEF